MEKPQLINFIAKVMEESGFKVYKNFKTSQKIIDIYAILPTTIGDFGVVMACKNYDRTFDVGVDVLKEMEEVGETLKASKVAIVTSSYFSTQAKNYALRKNIKLVDRDNLLVLAKNYSKKEASKQSTFDDIEDSYENDSYIDEGYPEYEYDNNDIEYISRSRDSNPHIYKNSLYRSTGKEKQGILANLFSKNKSSNNYHGLAKYPYRQRQKNYPSTILGSLKPLLSNSFVLIILVVAISYFLSYFLGNIMKVEPGISGLVEMIAALILSYGFVFKFGPRDEYVIIKGTIVFFISLIILILLIIL